MLGSFLPELRTPVPGPASRALADRLSRVESRNVTWLADDFPVFWREAQGSNVLDADGNRFLDLTGAFGVAAAGHQHPRIVEAIRDQAGSLTHGMGDVHPPEVKVHLLERLAAISPWKETRILLASSGSEAVEIALKTAQLRTRVSGAIAFQGGYHGLTLGALSVTARDDFRTPFRARLPKNVRFVPFPDPLRQGSFGALQSLEQLDEAIVAGRDRGEPAGCVIVEPIQGRGGIRIPPPGFLSEVARRTREAGALFVLDEIFTGLGRTGSRFAFEEEEVVPDLLLLGKSLGGGLPLSACLGPREIMDSWPPSKGEALHTSTFLGHPLACAAALAYLDILEEEGLAARSREEGARMVERLAEGLADLPEVGEVRGRGLFIGIELVRPSQSPERSPEPWAGAGASVATALLREGVLVLPAGDRGEVIELTPPLTIARPLLDWAVDRIVAAVRTLIESDPTR